MKFKLAVAAVLFPAVAWAWPWSTDMADQPAIEPQQPISEERMEMHPFPKRSIPVGGIPTTVADREEARDMANPIPVSDASLNEGRTLFKIYCAACHGLTGKADAPITGKIGAPPLVENPYIDSLSEGWLFGTITFGSFLMPAYGVPQGREDERGANDLTVDERWHIVNYLRHGLARDAQSQVRTASQAR